MLKLTVDQNSITREVWFDLRFHAPISYEEFCNNPEYESIFDNSSIHSAKPLFEHAFWAWWEIKDFDPFEKIISNFMAYNYQEIYENIFDRLHFPYLSDDEYNKLKIGEYNDLFALEACLDDIKCIKTRNNFFYYYENWELIKHTRLMYPVLMGEFNEWKSKYQQEVLRRAINSEVKFSQTRSPNKIANYLLFLSIVSDIKLYIFIHPYQQSYIIIDEYHINKNIPTRFLGVYITNLFNWLISFSSSDYIQSIKDKYKHSKGDQTIRVFQDLQEAIKTNANLKIKLNVNKWDINYVDTEFRDQDLSKYHYLKNMISNSDTSHISIENHKGKPSAVVWHSRKRYDK